MTHFENNGKVHLALNRRALYTFDDFLLSRYHMYLMVYFHHKGIVYDEMLLKYLKSKDCDFQIPSKIEDYIHYDDYKLHTQMSTSQNTYAKLISDRRPYRRVFESHDKKSELLSQYELLLKESGIDVIRASSTGRLSKYYSGSSAHNEAIYVIEKDHRSKPVVSKIEDASEIFEKYQVARKIERLYVSPDVYKKAEEIRETNQF